MKTNGNFTYFEGIGASKFSSLNPLILNETFLEMSCQYNFGKNKIEYYLFGGELGLISILGQVGPNLEKCV